MCRETCVYSAMVRDVLISPVEFKGLFTHIKNNPKYNIIFRVIILRVFIFMVIIFRVIIFNIIIVGR